MKNLIHRLVYRMTIQPRLKALQRALPGVFIHPTGSRYVCNPPVLSTDIDFLVYSESTLTTELVTMGYTMTPWFNYSGVDDKSFKAWRKGRINLIVTDNRGYAETFLIATHICKANNVRSKAWRVFIHEGVRGNYEGLSPSWEMDMDDQRAIKALLESFNGQYRAAMLKTYMVQHDLKVA